MSQPIDPTDAILVAFIRSEIKTGLLFADISARAGDDHERRERHRRNAELAHESAAKFLASATLTADEATELHVSLETLRVAIAGLT